MGQTFLGFQWDILLLETGFTTIFFVPFLWKKKSDNLRSFPSPALWMLRWILFKLMLMSGVVKIQADCPTWTNLTALEYHFATQCIPTPLAWLAHQVPPLLQRASVAATLVIELPAPFLLIAPWTLVRRVGVMLQVMLQIPIILTGNYGFFNLLTMALCLPVWDSGCTHNGDLIIFTSLEVDKPNLFSLSSIDQLGIFSWAIEMGKFLKQKIHTKLYNTLLLIMSFGSITWACAEMFQLEILDDSRSAIWGDQYRIHFLLTKAKLETLILQYLPHVFAMYGLAMIVSTCLFSIGSVSNAVTSTKPGMFYEFKKGCSAALTTCWSLGLGSILFMIFCISCVPLTSLHQGLQSKTPRAVGFVFQSSQNWRLTAGYGLFRRMTGVGKPPKKWKTEEGVQKWGVGELPPSIVQRPEVNLEGSADGGKTWEQVDFLFKPGASDKSPLFVAPHQPRLDWQMWFAALGPYQQAPWFIHLLDKIFEGCTPVLGLLDYEAYPFKDKPPELLRSNLFHYDFTRKKTTWNEVIPKAHIISGNSTEWWHATQISEYTPVLGSKNPSVEEFMGQYGWKRRSCKPITKEKCNTYQFYAQIGCNGIVMARDYLSISRPTSVAFIGQILMLFVGIKFLFLAFVVPFNLLVPKTQN